MECCIFAAIVKCPKNAEQKIRMSRKTTKAYLLYGEEDDADRRILCRHYWIFCNSGEYNVPSSKMFCRMGAMT